MGKQTDTTRELQEFGERIRKAREGSGMQQKELATVVHVSAREIGFYEHGERYPKLETLVRICKCLNVSISELIPCEPNTRDHKESEWD